MYLLQNLNLIHRKYPPTINVNVNVNVNVIQNARERFVSEVRSANERKKSAEVLEGGVGEVIEVPVE